MRTAIFATLLLLGCGKSDRGISSGPYPCVSEVTVAGEGTCKPLVLTVDKNGQKVYVESDRVTSQPPATERLGTVATSIPKPPVLPPHPVVEISGGVFYLPTDSDSAYVLRYCCKENLPKGFWTIESGDTTSPYHDITMAAGSDGDSGKGVTITNKRTFTVDAGVADSPIPPSHEAAVYAELWKICKEKKLKYAVSCNPGEECYARAWDADSWSALFVNHWDATAKEGDSTAAAESLVKALKGPKNRIVERGPSMISDPDSGGKAHSYAPVI